jgi:hypothetical protein
MIVPSFWAEGRVQHRADGRQRTIRRFGWSNESQGAAQQHANVRAANAMARALAGDAVDATEPAVGECFAELGADPERPAPRRVASPTRVAAAAHRLGRGV